MWRNENERKWNNEMKIWQRNNNVWKKEIIILIIIAYDDNNNNEENNNMIDWRINNDQWK